MWCRVEWNRSLAPQDAGFAANANNLHGGWNLDALELWKLGMERYFGVLILKYFGIWDI